MAPITLTYTSHPAPSQHINAAVKGLRAQLPLRNLHWKPSTRTSLRTIQEVDVELVELGDVPTGARSGLGSVLEQPLVNICLVVCEDSDTYKNHTKSFIRDWLSLLSSRRSATTPLIVLVNPPTSVAASGKNVFGRDKGVLGKLKSDFNTGKRDRCAQVNLPPEGRDDPAAWPEVINKIKESVVLAFDTAIVEREEEVKRGEAQRMMVGWNFCTWFLLKESLAHSFEAVGLPADALIIYEELEATFFQILKEQNLSWFGKLGATSPRDDSLPVLDTKVKPYREMLQGSAISIFDFRIYEFARQAILLGQLGRITEVAKRGQWFIASLTRRLRECEGDLAEHFIESWTYTASMDIVHKCDEWSRIDRPNGDYSGLVAYESARSELLDIARTQVERLGVAAGHLPNEYPFASAAALLDATDDVLFESSETGSQPDQSGEVEQFHRAEMSNRELLEAKQDKNKFYPLYTGLTKKAILAYEACGKMNSVVRLKTDLAALALLTDDWKAAYDLCTSLAKACAEQSVWNPVARYALEGALRSHQALELVKGSEWAFLVMAYLRTMAALPEGQMPPESDLLPFILAGIGQCTADLKVVDHEAFEVKMRERETTESDSLDVISTAIEVVNRLSVNVPVEKLAMIGTSANGSQLRFHATDVDLKPGVNAAVVTCRSLVQGPCIIDEVSFQLGSIRMTFAATIAGQQVLMRRPVAGLSATVSMPRDISLGADPQVLVEVQTNGISAENVSLQLQSDDPSVQYDLTGAQGDGQATDTPTADYTLGDMKAESSKRIMVPYLGRPHNDWTSARLSVSYTASDGQQSEWSGSFQLNMGSPFAVNVQDFFRPHCLMSQYSITADGRECFRIESVTLSPPDEGYRIEGGGSTGGPMVVTPDEALTRIFKVVPTAKPDVNADAALCLLIRYINVKEEVQHMVDQNLSESSSKSLRRKIGKRIQDHGWSERYLTHGWPAVFTPEFRAGLPAEDALQLDRLLVTLSASSPSDIPWRTLEILVDMPLRRILTSVDMSWRQTRADERLYEGRAVAITCRMRSSFVWSGEAAWHEAKLVYDVSANPEDWLVLGKKKGFYDLTAEGGEHETEIVLVPVRSGHLFLPNIVVSLLGGYQQDGPITETHVENAAETLEVLPAKGGGVTFIPLEPNWEVEAERRM